LYYCFRVATPKSQGGVDSNVELERERLLRFHRLKAEERRKRILEEEAKAKREEAEEKLRRKEEFKERRKMEKVIQLTLDIVST